MARKITRFPKKRIFITGAGSGLGRALALRFAAEGWKIAIADINMERAEETATLVRGKGGEAMTLRCDVSRPEEIEKAAASVKEAWGGIDILVNNAGIAAAGTMECIPLEEWDRIININFKSVVYGCRTFIPLMKEQGAGHIVNVASNAGIASLPEMASYNATKAAVISLSETLRAELAEHGIGVTAVCPSFVKTNLMESFHCTDETQRVMAMGFFNTAICSPDEFADYTCRSIAKNRLYSIAQRDGRFVWRFKRRFPELYSKLVIRFNARMKERLLKYGK
jgi:NAD(P)-dependent dehydrogenase (short-subunit alcohol dehydrogenase family)